MERIAARLGEANDQSLGHFLANTPWDPVPVRARLARKMHKAIEPAAWVADDSGFRKGGRMSPCVARQYTGTAGKITNCQVATTLHLASDQASCPIDWRLFMPESWDPYSDKAGPDVQTRRAAAEIPDDERHRPKWQLALECVDEALSLGTARAAGAGRRRRLRRRRPSAGSSRNGRPARRNPPHAWTQKHLCRNDPFTA